MQKPSRTPAPRSEMTGHVSAATLREPRSPVIGRLTEVTSSSLTPQRARTPLRRADVPGAKKSVPSRQSARPESSKGDTAKVTKSIGSQGPVNSVTPGYSKGDIAKVTKPSGIQGPVKNVTPETSKGDTTKTTKPIGGQGSVKSMPSKAFKNDMVKSTMPRGSNKSVTSEASKGDTAKITKPSGVQVSVKSTLSESSKGDRGKAIKPSGGKGSVKNILSESSKGVTGKATKPSGGKESAKAKPSLDPGKLASLESPFSWKLADFKDQLGPIMDFLRAKLEKKVEYRDERHEGDSKWRVLIINLLLCYECYKLGEKSKALSYVDDSNVLVTSVVTSSQDKVTSSHDKLTSSEDSDDLVLANSEAFLQIFKSCRYHLASSAVDRKAALDSLSCRARLTDKAKASLLGIRAAVTMEYGPTATCAALTLLEKAVTDDSTAFQWRFLLAKCLGRQRRVESFEAVTDVPYSREVEMLEEVVRLSGKPFHVVFLAGVCRGVADTLSQGEGPELMEQVQRLYNNAVKLYEQAALSAPDCAFTNIRCAEGFMLLPLRSHQNMNRAYQLGERVVKLAPGCTMINHIWGRINEVMGFEQKALRHLEAAARAGSFKANLDLLALKLKLEKTYSPISELEDMLEVFHSSVHHQEICAQICSHCLLVLEDLPRAVEWCGQVLRLDPRSDKLTHHRCLSQRDGSEINLYRELMTRGAVDPDKVYKKDHLFFELVSACRSHYPELLHPAPSRSQVLYDKVKAVTARTRSLADEILAQERCKSATTVKDRPSRRSLDEAWRAASGRSWYRVEAARAHWGGVTSHQPKRRADLRHIPPEIVWKLNWPMPRFLDGREL